MMPTQYQTSTGNVTGPAAGPTQDVLSSYAQLLGLAQPVIANTLQTNVQDILQNPQVAGLIQAIQQAGQQNFQQSVLPAINTAAQQSGNFFSTGRQGALEQAGQQFGQGQTQALAGPLFDLFNSLRAQQLGAAQIPAAGILGAAPLYGQQSTVGVTPGVGPLGIAGTVLGGLGSLAGGLLGGGGLGSLFGGGLASVSNPGQYLNTGR